MTEITKDGQNTPILTPDDILHAYQGTDAVGDVPKIGIEIEQTLYNAADLSLVPATDSAVMVAQGEKDGVPIHHEPSATSLETVTDPFTPNDLGELLTQIDDRFGYFTTLVKTQGYALSSFGHMPHVSLGDHEIVDKERYKIFWNPPRADKVGASSFFANCMNIQVSASYKTPDCLLKTVRLATALEPLIFLSTDSNAGFFENSTVNYSLPLHLNTQKGVNGGIPDFYYTAQNGEDFINKHIDFSFNHKHMIAYFDHDENLQKIPTGQFLSYADLMAQDIGPATSLNYRQAQSMSWRRACNIATIDNADGQLINHRAELASFQTGLMHQRYTAPLLTNLIAFNENFQVKAAALLKTYGIDLDNLTDCKGVLEGNFKSAVYHDNMFSTVQFSTGTLGQLARDIADIVENCYAGTPFEKHVQPILHIWRAGRPDWLVYREKFETLESVKTYLQNFPKHAQDTPALLDPLSCADWALRD